MAEETPLVSATDIVRKYLKKDLDPAQWKLAANTYEALCLSFKNIAAWGKADAMGTVLSQLLENGAPLLDRRCGKLVSALLAIDLCELSVGERQLWCGLMVQVVMEQVCWAEKVIEHLCKRLCPVADSKTIVTMEDAPEEVLLWPEDVCRAVYTEIQRALWRLVQEFPAVTFILKKYLEKCFPFLRRPTFQIKDYFLNLLHLTTWGPPPELLMAVWKILVEKLVEIDTQRTIKAAAQRARAEAESFFVMDEEMGKNPEAELLDSEIKALTERLDVCLSTLFKFLQFWCFTPGDGSEMNSSYGEDRKLENYKHDTGRNIFNCLLAPLRESLLGAHDPKYTPFIWFFLSSFNAELCDSLLKFLWKEVESPVEVGESLRQNERKGHSAACYMAGLIARGNFVHIRVARKWVCVWTEWAKEYLDVRDSPGRSSSKEGHLSHGTFYAVCQAVFFVVGFRYKEFSDSGLDEMKRWGLDRLANCSLNPFQYCAPHVVINFANVCRAMQFVYCHHIIERNRRKTLHDKDVMATQSPFESFFPFDPCDLPECSQYINPIYRNYHGLSDDTARTAASESIWNKGRSHTISINDEFDFLEESDLLISYGTSPGFRHIPIHLEAMDT